MKLLEYHFPAANNLSPPARGAWIETQKEVSLVWIDEVAPCAGGVD